MTTLGSLFKGGKVYTAPLVPPPLDIVTLVASLATTITAAGHSVSLLGDLSSVVASVQAWVAQDNDAHEPCSLTACRHPLHPGPCKGWKGTLHSVSPGTYKQIEEARVEKANARRVKRIADLRSQGKPIPRALLTEIKPKPAPVTHVAQNAQTVPLGQVNQKADLAGGQAHAAGQAVTKAAGVTVKTPPPLPLGPKKQKPTVAGRGPAFVITQPKVTDTYKLDKADKITPAEWSALTDADKTTIRNELTAIKARGFGPQQAKADTLLAKLPAPGAVGTSLKPGAPGTVTTPSGKVFQKVSATPGKVTLGQASKTPQLAAPAPSPTRGTRDQNGILNKPLPGGSSTSTSVGLPNGYRISRDNMGYSLKHNGKLIRTSATQAALEQYAQDHAKANNPANVAPLTTAQKLQGNAPASPHGLPATPPTAPRPTRGVPDVVDQIKKAQDPSAKLTPAARTYVYRKLTKDQFDSLDAATKQKVLDDLDVQIAKTGGPGKLAQDLKDKFGASGTPSQPAQAAPTPSPSSPVPAAPMAPGTAAHIQHANAVAHRSAPKSTMAKAQVDAYDKLSKADFDSLDPAAQKVIRDDLANAKAKFLDPKKQQAASDLLDRFGSRHPTPVGPAGSTALTPTNVAALIRKNGSADLMLGGKKVTVGFAGGGHDGKLEMVPGGQYVVTMKDGTKHPLGKGQLVTVAPSAPSTPANAPSAKGYSDPMSEAVKAASSGLVSVDDLTKRVGQLSPSSIANLTPADRKLLGDRLAFVATHRSSSPQQAAKAEALKRIMENGSPALRARKWDHTPTLNELHAEEQKNGAAKDALKVAAALDAANDPNTPLTSQHDDRVKTLGALSKAQFDALSPVDQRKIIDALQELYTAKQTNHMTVRDPDAEKAITLYTGEHPGLHRLRQAEADFQAGKIDAKAFRQQYLHARVASPTKMNDPAAPGAVLEKEAQKVAERNPKLPIYIRAELIDNPYSSSATYTAISRASSEFSFEDAPRLSQSDITGIFRATEADLAASHPLHAQAVKELRENLLLTGLRGDPGVSTGSPWSLATRNHVVDNLLHISNSEPEIPPERLKEFLGLPPAAQVNVTRVLRERLNSQSNVHAKTGTYLALQELDGHGKAAPDVQAALLAAADRFGRPDLDVFRKLDPIDYQGLPLFARQAISDSIEDHQTLVTGRSMMARWTPQDNALKVMPLALKAHLAGERPAYPDRNVRNASDLANYGTNVVAPIDRLDAYTRVTFGPFQNMTPRDQGRVIADLDKLATSPASPLHVRYTAQRTKDINLGRPSHLNADQLLSIGATDPANPSSDPATAQALTSLSKADFDALAPAYRDAIDARIKSLPGTSQQGINATLHPQAAPATPSGFTPTGSTAQAPVPPHVQAALDTIYGVHSSGKSHTMAHQLSTYGALRGHDFAQLNAQEQGQLLGDLSFIATTAKGPSADKAKKLIDRFSPPGTPAGQVPTGAAIPPANAVAGQTRYATPLKGLFKAKDSGKSGDKWISIPGHGRVWGEHGAAGMLIQHVDPQTGEKRYLMVQRGPAISDPGKWTFPGGASDSKETAHEGATRETIEELGLKDDVFKDALVHGDHTFSIPGSTWKYTTVAVQVPTMIKPDLSSYHARQETSDAKWMTESEIKALDQSGKLHGPIAGGKLEQNVMSLYPQGSGVTLGQVARPGPVSKRLGRLKVPFGGRQAPANFNAWTHAHKPSKGKDLIGDKAATDALRQKIKQDRKLYDGKTADGRLAAIGAAQGFDDTPTVLDKKDIDALLASGDYIEAWRGVRGAGGYSSRGRGSSGGKTSTQINEEMRSGPAYYGTGIFGNGYYLATQRSVARQYADGSSGSVVRILIPKSAVTKKYDEAKTEAFKNPRTSAAKGSSSYESSTLYDPGRWAAAKGLDGIEINSHHISPGGGASHVASRGKPAFNWLNRSVLILQKEPG